MRGNAREHASRQGSGESESLQKRIVKKKIPEPQRTRRKGKREKMSSSENLSLTQNPSRRKLAAQAQERLLRYISPSCVSSFFPPCPKRVLHAERVLRRATHVGHSRGYLCPWLSVCLYTDSLPGHLRENGMNPLSFASSHFPSASFASTLFRIAASTLFRF